MTRTTLRSTLGRASAAAVAVLAIGALPACGGDDGGGDETSSDASSPATDDANDDPAESEGSEESGEEIEPSEFIDLYLEAMDKATTATLEMSFGGTASVQGKGAADFSTTPPAMQMSITDESTGQDHKLLIVDGIMYLGISAKQYVQYDLSDPNSPLGTDLTDQLDPRAMAEVFEDGVTGASYVGEEDVAGESMEHYRVTLDSAALLDEADLPSDAPSDAIDEELTFEIWFDDEGMVRRQEAGLGVAGNVELSYDNWGEPVDIKAPPESQITKLPSGG